MIPKIIHNIWIQGYENLPNENKIHHLNIKKLNPDWEFMIWDDEMIKNLLQKYPKIYDIYKKSDYYSGSIENNIIKSDIARYIIMKEYGGLYFDIEFKCKSTFDDVFLNKNIPVLIIAAINTAKINELSFSFSILTEMGCVDSDVSFMINNVISNTNTARILSIITLIFSISRLPDNLCR